MRAELGAHHDRNANFGRVSGIGTGESGWTDTYNGERITVDDELRSNHLRIGRKPALPVSVAQHGYWVTTLKFVIFGGEQSANRGLQSEHREVVPGYKLSGNAFSSAIPTDTHRRF